MIVVKSSDFFPFQLWREYVGSKYLAQVFQHFGGDFCEVFVSWCGLRRPRPVLPPVLKGLPGNARSSHPEERFGPDLSKGRPGRRWSSFASKALPRKVPSCGSRMGTYKDGSPCMIFKFDASKHDLLCRWGRKTQKLPKRMSYLKSHQFIPKFDAEQKCQSGPSPIAGFDPPLSTGGDGSETAPQEAHRGRSCRILRLGFWLGFY